MFIVSGFAVSDTDNPITIDQVSPSPRGFARSFRARSLIFL
jgi:hypothetical protein